MISVSFYIGLDIGAQQFAAAIRPTAGGTGSLNASIPNSLDGFQEFFNWLEQQHVTPENAVICLEATGVYGEALCYFLCAHGFHVAVEPPLKVKRAFDYAGHKNDSRDAQQIAEYAQRFFDELTFWQPPEATLEHLHILIHAREQLVRQRTSNKNLLKALQRKPVQTLIVTETIEQTITHLTGQITILEDEIRRLLNNNHHFHQLITILTSVPGIGMLSAATLILITQAFTTSASHKQLSAYLGICPYEHTSGSSIRRRAQSRRTGPPLMRKLLYLAAMSVSRHDPTFRQYYLRKVTEGKSPRLVINNIENKLIKIACALNKSQSPYIPNFKSVSPMLLHSS